MARYNTLGLIVKAAPHVAIIGSAARNHSSMKRNAKNSPEALSIKETRENVQATFNDPKTKMVDPIILVDIDYYKDNNTPTQRAALVDGRESDRIVLPTVPLEIEFNPEPQWNTIASIGRNAPFYNYSGSEDTLTFKIDWYSTEEHKEDVIYACRWVEALTKSNGYKQDPHRIMVIWGKADRLFYRDIWIVFKAPYTMSQFQKHKSMLPQQAYQEIVLKKVLETNSETINVFNSFSRAKSIPNT